MANIPYSETVKHDVQRPTGNDQVYMVLRGDYEVNETSCRLKYSHLNVVVDVALLTH